MFPVPVLPSLKSAAAICCQLGAPLTVPVPVCERYCFVVVVLPARRDAVLAALS